MCGSFVRFYGEEKDKNAVNQLYASGGEGIDLSPMVHRWESWLDEQRLPPEVLKTAQALLNRPSIFSKVCAHELAARRSEAINHELSGELDAALEVWRSVDADATGDQQSLLKRISILARLGREDESRALVDSALRGYRNSDQPTLSHLYHLRIKEWAIDLDDQTLDKDGKRAAYRSLAEESLDRPTWRRLAIKAYAHSQKTADELRELIVNLLSSKTLTAEKFRERLESAAEEWPHDAALLYLRARANLRDDHQELADQLLRESLALGLPHHSLIYESLKLRAQIAFRAQEYTRAEQAYLELSQRLDLHILGGEREELSLWARRAAFFREQMSVVQ